MTVRNESRRRGQLEVWIDQDLCTGDGICAQYAPEVFELDIDGLAYVKSDGDELLQDPGATTPVPLPLLNDVGTPPRSARATASTYGGSRTAWRSTARTRSDARAPAARGAITHSPRSARRVEPLELPVLPLPLGLVCLSGQQRGTSGVE